MPRFNFTPLKNHYGIDPATKTAILRVEGYQNLLKLKELHDRPQPILQETSLRQPARVSSFTDIVQNIGVQTKHDRGSKSVIADDFPPLPTTTMGSMTSVTRAGARDVQGDLQRQGVHDPNLLQALSQVFRGIESNLMTRFD